MNITRIKKEKLAYNENKHCIIDNILDDDYLKTIMNEILNSSKDKWDRYENPFERKLTWRNKNELLPLCQELFETLHSKEFIDFLSEFTGYKLQEDKSKNWWGIHTFKNGDKLDIHVDAGKHPENNLKKIITLGIYMSKNWNKDCGGEIEFWSGDNSSKNDAKIYEKIISIEPKFNRMIIFENNDYSWHGAPTPCACNENQQRIFLTCSYLTDIDDSIHKNNRKKAFFVKLPDEVADPEKDKLRLLRADPEKYKEIYRINQK